MSYKFKINTSFPPIGLIETSIGEIAVFTITVGEQSNAIRSLDLGLDKCSGKDYVKAIARYICHKKDVLNDDKLKPSKPTLTEDEIEQLSEEDIEKIAQTYLKDSKYLYRKTSFEPNKEGQIEIGEGEIKYPKKENESSSDYLIRLIRLNEKELQDKWDRSDFGKIAKSIAKLSTPIQSDIFTTISQGEKLSNAITDLEKFKIKIPEVKSVLDEKSIKPIQDVSKLQYQELQNLTNRIDSLIGVNSQLVDYINEVNKLQSKISGEISTSSEKASESSKKALWTSRFIVLIGSISLIVSTFFRCQDQKATKGYVQEIKTAIDSVNVNDNNSNFEKEFQEYKDSVSGKMNELQITLDSLLSEKKKKLKVNLTAPKPH